MRTTVSGEFSAQNMPWDRREINIRGFSETNRVVEKAHQITAITELQSSLSKFCLKPVPAA